MSRSLPTLRALTLGAATLAGVPMHAQPSGTVAPAPIALETLGRLWSGNDTPSCGRTAALGNGDATIRRCTWRGTGDFDYGASEHEFIVGESGGGETLQVLFWSRKVADSTAGSVLLDSLDRAMRDRGYTRRTCQWGYSLWEVPGFSLLAGIGARSRASGRVSMSITALIDRRHLPVPRCPGIPAPAPPALRIGR